MPLARFIAKHVDALRVPFKRYAIGSVFRGERPGKGRFREFTQCDFDFIDIAYDPLADLEIIQVVYESLQKAQVPPFTIAINHRKILNGLFDTLGLTAQSGAILRSLDKLGKIGRDGVLAELQRGPAANAPTAIGHTTILPIEQTWLNDPDLAAVEKPADDGESIGKLAGGPGLSTEHAERVLDFVERGRGGDEVLNRAAWTPNCSAPRSPHGHERNR